MASKLTGIKLETDKQTVQSEASFKSPWTEIKLLKKNVLVPNTILSNSTKIFKSLHGQAKCHNQTRQGLNSLAAMTDGMFGRW